MQLYKAILAQYGQNVAGGIGSFSQMGFLLGKFVVQALRQVKAPYTIKSVNAAFKAIKDVEDRVAVSAVGVRHLPAAHPEQRRLHDRRRTTGRWSRPRDASTFSAADPQIAQYRRPRRHGTVNESSNP